MALQSGSAKLIEDLSRRWFDLRTDDWSATQSFARNPPSDQERHAAAWQRILHRRDRMLALVQAAVAVPLDIPADRHALQAFADRIESVGSVHAERDLELIEARLAKAMRPGPARRRYGGLQVIEGGCAHD
jgi:hypothetical protein